MAEGDFADWIGCAVESDDPVTDGPLRRLAAALDHDRAHWPAAVLPPLGHWLFHLPDAAQSALAPDGHPERGEFMPPIPQPRRMWAGGRLRFLQPVPVGAVLTKRTTVAAIVPKGAMTFVTLRHDLAVDGVAAIVEEQDLVYLPIAAPGVPRPVPVPAAASERRIVADETLLFRFSALTFNAHRIHYDLGYAQGVEHYPALVVHGPLQAMLLIDHALRDGIVPGRFDFRARAPLYPGPLTLARAGEAAWVRAADGTVTMTATIAAGR